MTVFGYSIFKTVIYEVIKMGSTPVKGHLATPVIGNLDTQTTGIALPGGKAMAGSSNVQAKERRLRKKQTC